MPPASVCSVRGRNREVILQGDPKLDLLALSSIALHNLLLPLRSLAAQGRRRAGILADSIYSGPKIIFVCFHYLEFYIYSVNN